MFRVVRILVLGTLSVLCSKLRCSLYVSLYCKVSFRFKSCLLKKDGKSASIMYFISLFGLIFMELLLIFLLVPSL